MSVKRVVPDIKSTRLAESRVFYGDFLGMTLAMDMGFIMTFVAPGNPTSQVSIMRDSGAGAMLPDVSIEVEDVDDVHRCAVERGFEIVYPITDEPWGVRRFFVVDPNGAVVNILSHRPAVRR